MKANKIETILTLSFIIGILVLVIHQANTLRQMQADCMLHGGDIAKAHIIDSLQRRIDSLENHR